MIPRKQDRLNCFNIC